MSLSNHTGMCASLGIFGTKILGMACFNPIQPGGGHYGPPYETFLDSISAMKNVTLKLLDF